MNQEEHLKAELLKCGSDRQCVRDILKNNGFNTLNDVPTYIDAERRDGFRVRIDWAA